MKRIMDKGSKITAVLADCYLESITTVPVNVAEITDSKQISDSLRILEQLSPLEGFKHLKRMNVSKKDDGTDKFEVILCPMITEKLQEILSKCSCLHGVRVTNVPAKPPLTRHQYNEASKLWSTKFHEDKKLTRLIDGTLFQKQDVDRINCNMKKALEIAKTSLHQSQVCIGACIVEPKSNVLIAVATDHRHQHPIHHAVMICIDQVAHSQGSGAFHTYSEAKTCLTDSKELLANQYLCTDLELYCTREPCVMCAMALVHSRIGRVFYGTSDPCGALGTQYKIHTKDGLNHHFQVFKNVLENECQNHNS